MKHHNGSTCEQNKKKKKCLYILLKYKWQHEYIISKRQFMEFHVQLRAKVLFSKATMLEHCARRPFEPILLFNALLGEVSVKHLKLILCRWHFFTRSTTYEPCRNIRQTANSYYKHHRRHHRRRRRVQVYTQQRAYNANTLRESNPIIWNYVCSLVCMFQKVHSGGVICVCAHIFCRNFTADYIVLWETNSMRYSKQRHKREQVRKKT